MPALARTRSYQYLDVYTGTPGAIADAAVVQFVIYDISDAAKLLSPEQVYPVLPTARASLDVTADDVGTGHYRTTWAPVDVGTTLAPRGRHRISWFWKLTVDGDEERTDEEFDVVDTPRSWGYALPSDLRDEGLTTSDASAQRLATVITLATGMIERYCGRFFEPREQTLQLDGRGNRAVLVDHPIIWAETMRVTSLFDVSYIDLDLSYLLVYNRHLTDGLFSPDDRNNPKIELLRTSTLLQLEDQRAFAPLTAFTNWPHGRKNVHLTGVFGYTEPDGSATGGLPPLIRHACKLLVMREFPVLTDADEREDRQDRWRVTAERTRDQSRSMVTSRRGNFTFDPTIDTLLDGFRRPPQFGAV